MALDIHVFKGVTLRCGHRGFGLPPASSVLVICYARCEGSEDMAGKISENRYFRGPHSHLKLPRQRTPPNIRINCISLETAIHGLHFCR